MGEGNIFTLCVSPHLDWGEGGLPNPMSGQGRTPSQVWTGGGGPLHPRSGWGYPIPGLDREGTPSSSGWGVYPIQSWPGGVPHPRSEQGVLHPVLARGAPVLARGFSPSSPGQEGVLHPRSGWGGTPHPGLDGLTSTLGQDWMGYPPPIRWSSIANTCYAVGGMPLALTQEEFLVLFWFLSYFHRQKVDYWAI